MWPFIKEAQEHGAKVVAIDPLRHRTAQSADWSAAALGMMHVIINEGLIDKDYIERYTVGYEQLAERVQEYPPDQVSRITGIPVDDIVTLAREYATTQPWPAASGWPSSARPTVARRCALSLPCPPWWGPGATWAGDPPASPVGLPPQV